jgi:BASS family bile acid:Na+ symporter
MYEALLKLDTIRLHFNQDGLLALNIALGFIMFGVALGIKLKNFKQIFLQPKKAIVGIASQFFLLPFLTFIFAIAFSKFITPGVALGMILVASCPGGNISNFISSLAKANTELSISLTAFATMAAIVMTPFNFAVWGGWYLDFVASKDAASLLQPLQIDPVQIFKTVFILLGIPLILGMIFAHKFPKITSKIIKPIQTLSLLIFMGMVVIAFVNNAEYFLKYIFYVVILVLLHNALALVSGFSFASLMKLDRADRRTITIETGIQNSGLALVLLFNENIFDPLLPIGGMIFIAAWWGIWHILSGIGIATVWKRIPLSKF